MSTSVPRPLPFGPDDDAAASAFDDLPLWAAPFGLKLLGEVRMGHGLRALDVGFGAGFPLLELAGRLGESSLVCGVDLWPAGLRRATAKRAQRDLGNVGIVEATAERLPFVSGSFDVIVSNNGFNNVQDMGRAFAEANRVARAGAQLLFTMNTEASMPELYSEYRRLLEEQDLRTEIEALAAHVHARRKPLPEVYSLLEQGGWSRVRTLHDEFHMRYADGSAMLRHPMVRLAFLGSWLAVVGEDRREGLFQELERRLND